MIGDSMKKSLTILFSSLVFVLFCSCAPEQAINQGVVDKGPSVTIAPLPDSERMTIAIARFTNETHYGSGLFIDEHGDRIGKQASDSLARHLVATQRFIVVERQDLGRLKDEASIRGVNEDTFKKQLKGVDALIIGSVVELGRETTGKSWLVGKSKQQRARARVVLRVVDPVSGEIFYTTEGSGDATLETTATLGFGGTAEWDSTLEGKAIDAAIVNMINNVVSTLNTHKK
jgi:curli biogenesis system outer membrane secretion channel CsgG